MHEETDFWATEEAKELEDSLKEEGISMTDIEIKMLSRAFENALASLAKKKGYPYPPEDKGSCLKAGGEWENGKCIMPTKEYHGQAIVYEPKQSRRFEKIAEKLRNNEKIKEQWTAPLEKGTHELVGHAREFLPISRILENKPGDTVYCALVRDFDLGAWGTYGSPTLGDETGTDIISFDSATVKEAGVKFYMKQHLTEKADANILEMINKVSRRAVLRAEDILVLDTIYGTANVLSLDKSAAGVDFDADWIAEILSAYSAAGVSVDPGDIVLFVSPGMYEALFKDVAGAMAITFSRPDVIQKGRLTEFMGVTIRVVDKTVCPDDATNYYAIAFKKGGTHLFAPKRSFLMETQPDVANRRTLTVVSTACAYKLSNPKHGLKLKTQIT